MTSGERAVWAAAYVHAVMSGFGFLHSAKQATDAVKCLRRGVGSGDLDDDARAMLDDIFGVPR